MYLELLLANHHQGCATCVKSDRCKLQELAVRMGVTEVRFQTKLEAKPLDTSNPSLVRDPNKCILCGDCVRACEEIQGVGAIDFAYRGAATTVAPAFGKTLSEVACVYCGLCASVCPTGAITPRPQIDRVWQALSDERKTVVVQIAPAVRVALGEMFGLEAGVVTTGKMVAALKMLGFDKVFDTSFAADLTVLEETTEFLGRKTRGERLPQFTSCCPAWVKYAEQFCPELLPNLSSCRSPQQMFGSLAKATLPETLGIEREDLFVVSIMPCTAKKFEAGVPVMNSAGAGQDVDVVLTTREVERIIRAESIDVVHLPEEDLDTPLGSGSGAAVIFGATGGVMEAALRSAYYLVTGENPEPDAFKDVRGRKGWKEATFNLAGTDLNVAVASGLGNTRRLVEAIRRGEAHYHFVEIMACPGGCAGGGGQPIWDGQELAGDRADVLYGLDRISDIRFSHENPSITKCYQEYFEKPLSHKSHELLHTDHSKWELNPTLWEYEE